MCYELYKVWCAAGNRREILQRVRKSGGGAGRAECLWGWQLYAGKLRPGNTRRLYAGKLRSGKSRQLYAGRLPLRGRLYVGGTGRLWGCGREDSAEIFPEQPGTALGADYCGYSLCLYDPVWTRHGENRRTVWRPGVWKSSTLSRSRPALSTR